MKRSYTLATLLLYISIAASAFAQTPLKERPDAFPPKPETIDSKAILMATTVEEMANWDRYPTYETYLAMMQGWVEEFPTLCHIDTIGTSVQGRLILSMYIELQTDDDLYRPEFFYSSTMHGDEVTGFVMMLRLIDTLLNGFGSNPQYTELINRTRISINPLSNPDGTYRGGNNTVRYAQRYNANWVDLNRNYPDPFGTSPLDTQQVENIAMIDYVSNHNFRVSANLHGGSEVMNYPWDSFTSYENPHPDRDWWIAVCQRFIDTSRTYSTSHFRDVNSQGYIEGGDWYVISNGRQDYINYYHDCRELTMEISSAKMISSDQLPEYWRFLQHSLVNYIGEVHNLNNVGINDLSQPGQGLQFYPNPTGGKVFVNQRTDNPISIFNMQGQCLLSVPAGTRLIDLQSLPNGVYVLRSGTTTSKIVKQQ